MLKSPGPIAQGVSVVDTLDERQPRRIPTVLSFFHTGTKFRIEGSTSPPGASLYFSNVTVLVANASFAYLHSSGIMDFFELGKIARFCFMNRSATSVCVSGLAHAMKAREDQPRVVHAVCSS